MQCCVLLIQTSLRLNASSSEILSTLSLIMSFQYIKFHNPCFLHSPISVIYLFVNVALLGNKISWDWCYGLFFSPLNSKSLVQFVGQKYMILLHICVCKENLKEERLILVWSFGILLFIIMWYRSTSLYDLLPASPIFIQLVSGSESCRCLSSWSPFGSRHQVVWLECWHLISLSRLGICLALLVIGSKES